MDIDNVTNIDIEIDIKIYIENPPTKPLMYIYINLYIETV